MEVKRARLTVLMDPARKSNFVAICRTQDITPAQVARQLIRDFIAQQEPAAGSRAEPREPRRR